jgi:hypothetical protein
MDFEDSKEVVIYRALSGPILTQESVRKELGLGNEEIKKLFGLFKSKANGGVTIEHLAE